jgi:hypothetical protein
LNGYFYLLFLIVAMPSFTHEIGSFDIDVPERGRRGARPSFSSQKTEDRLREGERRPSVPASTKSSKKPQRRSVFKEEGLEDLNSSVHLPPGGENIIPAIRTSKEAKFEESIGDKENVGARKKQGHSGWYSKLRSRPMIKTTATTPPGPFSSAPRVALIAFLIAVVYPGFLYSGGKDNANLSGADAGVIRKSELVENASAIEGRQNSPTAVCTRWSHQSMF